MDINTRIEIRDGKYIKTARQRKHGVNKSKNGNHSNYGCTSANQQTNSSVVTIWQKAALTVEEAAAYSNQYIIRTTHFQSPFENKTEGITIKM